MTFVKIGKDWYEWPDKTQLRFYNYHNGWRTVDENDEEWLNARTGEFDSWHNLFYNTGYTTLARDVTSRDLWVAPNGMCFDGQAHAVAASAILEVVYGEEERMFEAEDKLIERGWIKLTTSFMLDMYDNQGMYDDLTYEQYMTVRDWCVSNNIALEEFSFYKNDRFDW